MLKGVARQTTQIKYSWSLQLIEKWEISRIELIDFRGSPISTQAKSSITGFIKSIKVMDSIIRIRIKPYSDKKLLFERASIEGRAGEENSDFEIIFVRFFFLKNSKRMKTINVTKLNRKTDIILKY